MRGMGEASAAESAADSRRHQSLDQFEEALVREMELQERRRVELRKRAANRSRAREIEKVERSGLRRFLILVVALSVTVIAVVFVMFEVLARLVGG